MALRVGFDVDGVLADFQSAFKAMLRGANLAAVSAEEGADPPPSATAIKRAWARVAARQNWWTSLPPYEPAQIHRLYSLSRLRRWEIFFMTGRPASLGDSVQFQTQWWLERHGFYLPSVVTVPGSRGELANALRLDLVVDDQQLNCMDVIAGSTAKALLVLRDPGQEVLRRQTMDRGVGVVSTLEETLDVVERFQQVLAARRGRLIRLTDWFRGGREAGGLPLDPRIARPSRDIEPRVETEARPE